MTSSVIYKHNLELVDEQSFELPVDATVLAVQIQGDELCLWETHLDDECTMKKSPRRVTIVGTGRPYDEVRAGKHIGTVQMPPFVWHVFMSLYS